MKRVTTSRGFSVFEFRDVWGRDCSLQESSSMSESRIWLGPNGIHRMHLSQSQAAALIPLLHHFVATGQLPPPVEPSEDAASTAAQPDRYVDCGHACGSPDCQMRHGGGS
jgi:hypothetical protein